MDERTDRPVAPTEREATGPIGHDGATDEHRAMVLARRAEMLAALPPPEASPDAFEALVFALGEERYAFPSRQVREVRSLDGLTALPGTPSFVAGLVNVRGRVVPVLDLRPLFGLPVARVDSRYVVLLSNPHGDVGILVTAAPEVRWLCEGELSDLPAGAPVGLDPAAVRGVTPALIVVLDAERVLADPRLIVQEEG